MRWKLLIPIIVALFILASCVQPSVGPPLVGEESRQVITMEVIDQIIYWECQSFWTEEKFAELSKNNLIAGFEGKYKVDARGFEVSLDEAGRSTIVKCQVYGCVSKGADRYTADFLWFLNPLGLDFIEDDFEKSKHGLSWEGSVNGVSMIIKIECPPQDSVYEAWQHPVGHCHGHVWWPIS